MCSAGWQAELSCWCCTHVECASTSAAASVCVCVTNNFQAAVGKLHQQLSLVGQPHSFLLKQLQAAEATAAAAQAELAAAKVGCRIACACL